jgi:hypothetical protein
MKIVSTWLFRQQQQQQYLHKTIHSAQIIIPIASSSGTAKYSRMLCRDGEDTKGGAIQTIHCSA